MFDSGGYAGKSQQPVGRDASVARWPLFAAELEAALTPTDREERSSVRAPDVSHYISNTLVFVKEFLRAAISANETGDEKRVRMNLRCIIEAVLDAQAYMTTLLDDVQNGKAVREDSHADCMAIINGIKMDFAHHLAKRNASIYIEGTLPCVIAEPTALDLLFRNLIMNSLQHAGRRDVRVRISREIKGGEVVICVSDNGRGFSGNEGERPPAVVDDHLVQVRGIPEKGLGLSYCRRAVEAWGGRLWIVSRSGKGAEIFFSARIAPSVEISHLHDRRSQSGADLSSQAMETRWPSSRWM